MKIISVRNVNDALVNGMELLHDEGVARDSRNGPVIMIDGPVTTHYACPIERVLFSELRDANPYFHFMEGLWMLAGRNDVSWIAQFNNGIARYSDDGKTFHGAYGYRWKNWFYPNPDWPEPIDQLATIADILQKNKDDRRCVVQMWDAETDLGRIGKDVPCNTQIMFSIDADSNLDMTVINRSNDMIWGAYGANAVHFSMLQEFMAAAIGVSVGDYWQISNNFHAYKEIYEKHLPLIGRPSDASYNTWRPFPMVNGPINEWLDDLDVFMSEGPVMGFKDVFFRKVVIPLYKSYMFYADKTDPDRFAKASAELVNCRAEDWQIACWAWLKRREDAYKIKMYKDSELT